MGTNFRWGPRCECFRKKCISNCDWTHWAAHRHSRSWHRKRWICPNLPRSWLSNPKMATAPFISKQLHLWCLVGGQALTFRFGGGNVACYVKQTRTETFRVLFSVSTLREIAGWVWEAAKHVQGLQTRPLCVVILQEVILLMTSRSAKQLELSRWGLSIYLCFTSENDRKWTVCA